LRAAVGHDQEDRQMTESRTKGRAKPARAFRPTFDQQLEARTLLNGDFSSPFGKNYLSESFHILRNPRPQVARNLHAPPQFSYHAPFIRNGQHFKIIRHIGTQTARGGQNVEVTATDGSHYMVSLSYTSNTPATNIPEGLNGQGGSSSLQSSELQVSQQSARFPQPIGTVRAYPMSGGRVGIIVDGSTQNTDLTINPLGQPQKKGFAHSFAYGESNRGHILNVGQITVNSGRIGAIEGFQTAVLSGPLVVSGPGPIDRIAFEAILPGASIRTSGDVNTLDVLNGLTLSGAGTGIFIGRDLNLLNVGSDLKISNGAVFSVARNLGLAPQPPKGTGTGSNVLLLNFNTLQNVTVSVTLPSPLGAFIQGNLIINTASGSAFLIGNTIFNDVLIEGGIIGFSGLLINAATSPSSPPFATRLTGADSSGFVVALQGETG
jgi:hypothetical protein